MSSFGTLEGTVYMFAPPGDPESAIEAGTLVALTASGTTDPIYAEAADDGSFSVELMAGSWIVGGEDAEKGCFAGRPATVQLNACETTVQNVILDLCIGG